MFIKLYESALFLKYYNVKLHINIKYFGETLEGTGQAEDYRLSLRNEPTSVVNKAGKMNLLKLILAIPPDSLFIYIFIQNLINKYLFQY